MKLFGFWTELPQVLCNLTPKLIDDFSQQAENIAEMCKRISASELAINQAIKTEVYDIRDSEIKREVASRMNSVESEKYLICCTSIKLSVKLINMIIKAIDGCNSDIANLKRLKTYLKLLHIISVKCNEEKSFSSVANVSFEKSKVEFFSMILNFSDNAQATLFNKSRELISKMRAEFQLPHELIKLRSNRLLGLKRENETAILNEGDMTCESSPIRIH